MRIYISLPMGGHEDTVRERYDDAVSEITKRYSNSTFVLNITGPVN